MTNQFSSLAPAPTMGKRFTDPAAEALWAALMTLEEGEKHDFLRELRIHLAVPEVRSGPAIVRVARATAALREAADILAEEPRHENGPVLLSERQFSRLRPLHGERAWPEASTIRRWLGGSWNDALRRARLEAVPDGDTTVTEGGGRYGWEEVKSALRACASDMAGRELTGPIDLNKVDFCFHEYLSWARRPDVRGRQGRRPRSQRPFDRFHGFAAAKFAALADEGPPIAASCGGRGTRWRRAGYGLRDEELHAAIRRVADHLGRVPRTSEFIGTREELIAADEASGVPVEPFASYNVIIARFGTWDAALLASRLRPFAPPTIDPVTRRARAEYPRNFIPEPVLLAGVREAYEEKGEPFTSGAYKSYVEERGRVSKDGRRLATYGCIYQRYRKAAGAQGPWKYICEKALAS